MGIVFTSNNDKTFEFDISGEWDLKKEFFVAIAFDVLIEVESILPRLEHPFAGALDGFVETLDPIRVYSGVQTVEDPQLGRVGHRVVAIARVVTAVVGRHCQRLTSNLTLV